MTARSSAACRRSSPAIRASRACTSIRSLMSRAVRTTVRVPSRSVTSWRNTSTGSDPPIGAGQDLGVGRRGARGLAQVGEPGAEHPFRQRRLQVQHPGPDQRLRLGAQEVGAAAVDVGQPKRSGIEHVHGVGGDVDGRLEARHRREQVRALGGRRDPAREVPDERLVVGSEPPGVGAAKNDRPERLAARPRDRRADQCPRAELPQEAGRTRVRDEIALVSREDRGPVGRTHRHRASCRGSGGPCSRGAARRPRRPGWRRPRGPRRHGPEARSRTSLRWPGR